MISQVSLANFRLNATDLLSDGTIEIKTILGSDGGIFGKLRTKSGET